MFHIPEKIDCAVTAQTVCQINSRKIRGALSRETIMSADSFNNDPFSHSSIPAAYTPEPEYSQVQSGTGYFADSHSRQTHISHPSPVPQPAPVCFHPVPVLTNLVQKGQKMPLGMAGQIPGLKIAMGWNVTDTRCDIDLSAYLLDSSGKVPGDNWFVFYGQTQSPDGSIYLDIRGTEEDREIVNIDLRRLDPSVARIVFVLTINEAFTQHLNFSMVKDAYIRLLDPVTNRELFSFMLTDYYSNVTSMMPGEIYLHNGQWKFNAIGNGVSRDLAGLCQLYGVQTE